MFLDIEYTTTSAIVLQKTIHNSSSEWLLRTFLSTVTNEQEQKICQSSAYHEKHQAPNCFSVHCDRQRFVHQIFDVELTFDWG